MNFRESAREFLRKRQSALFYVAVALAAVCLLILLSLGEQSAPAGPAPGKLAPNFKAKDLEGKEISLSGSRGTVVLLDFWTTWCAGCVMELPHLKRVYDTYKGDGFTVIGVNLDRSRNDFEHFVRMIGIDWPQVFDETGEIARLYNVDLLPATFLIDKNGVIRYTNFQGKAELENAVRDVLGLPPKVSPASRGGVLPQQPAPPRSPAERQENPK